MPSGIGFAVSWLVVVWIGKGFAFAAFACYCPPGFPSIALDCPRRKQRGFMVSVSVVKVKLYPGVLFGLYIMPYSAKVLKNQALTGFML